VDVQPLINSKADNSAEKRSRIGTLMIIVAHPAVANGAPHLPIYA